MKTMLDEASIGRVRDALRDAAQPRKIILFGSHARGGAGADSDLDLLVVEDEVADRFREMVRLRRALSPLRIPADVLVISSSGFEDLRETPGTVYHAADREGRVLYESP